MATIPPRLDPTLEAADAALVSGQPARPPRGYLGMSEIGEPCTRALWYGFRWASDDIKTASNLKAIADGNSGEVVQAARLRAVDGVELHTEDANTKAQFEFSDLGGHFCGHMDGAILGLLQAPKTWHVWEHKQSHERKQNRLIKPGVLTKLIAERGERQALKLWDEAYYGQAIMYMEYSGMTRHYLTIASPGGRHTISVRTKANKFVAKQLKRRARAIVATPSPLSRVSEKPEYYICKWCEHSPICHGKALPKVSCRTCCHATPEVDEGSTAARWSCALHRTESLTLDEQRTGCEGHLYLPALVTFAEQVDADSERNAIRYRLPDGRTFENGPRHDHGFASGELREMAKVGFERVMDEPGVAGIRQAFDARIEKAQAA